MGKNLDEETLEELDQLNFDNWMHYNKKLVRFLYAKPREPTEIISEKRFGEGIQLNKMLKRGVEFGAISNGATDSGRARRYQLTQVGEEYYLEMLKKPQRFPIKEVKELKEERRDRMACPQCGAKGTDIRKKMFVGKVFIIRITEFPGDKVKATCKACSYEGNIEDFTNNFFTKR